MMSSSQPSSKRPSSGSSVAQAKMPTEKVLHPAFSMRREVLLDDTGLVQPLVGVPVAAVEDVREAG